MIFVDVHDVFKFRNGPIRTEWTISTVVDRVFFPEALKVSPMEVVLVKIRLAHIDLVKGDLVRIAG